MADTEFRTYGNWAPPATRGEKGLSMGQTLGFMVGLFLTALVMWLLGLVLGIIFFIFVLLIAASWKFKDKDGFSIMEKMVERIKWMIRKSTKTTVHRGGLLGRDKYGRCLFPGPMGSSELYRFEDTYGMEFCIIDIPAQRTYATVIKVDPNGASLVDQDQINVWVGKYGGWIAQVSNESDIVGVTVTIDTSPTSGQRLITEIDGNIDPETITDFELAGLEQIKQIYPSMSATVKVFFTLIFSYPSKGRLNVEEVAADLAIRVPIIATNLKEAGVGHAETLTASELMEFVRTAYDPAITEAFEQAHANNEPIEQTWKDVGPVMTKTYWDYLEHDSGVSKTWEMTVAPRGGVPSTILARLLNYNGKIGRKRVSLIYKTLDAEQTARIVEKDVETANFNARTKKKNRITARDERLVELAKKNSQEEAIGAGLVDFGLVLTATGYSNDNRKEIDSLVRSIGGSARISLRPIFGNQDAGFALNLPVGFFMNLDRKI
jgi:hypothetical protein